MNDAKANILSRRGITLEKLRYNSRSGGDNRGAPVAGCGSRNRGEKKKKSTRKELQKIESLKNGGDKRQHLRAGVTMANPSSQKSS